jgi:hypothetical protein
MKQQTLTAFEQYGKPTRRAKFLADMERILPWVELLAVIEPVYPKLSDAGSAGTHAAHLFPATLVQLVGPGR